MSVSDERLAELIARHERDHGQTVHRDIAAALRELRALRSGRCPEGTASQEYVEFVEKDRDWWKDEAERLAEIVLATDKELKRRGIRLDVATSKQEVRKLPAAPDPQEDRRT